MEQIQLPKEILGEQTLIIGMGEVGKALKEILKEKYQVFQRDKGDRTFPPSKEHYRIIHICYPYSNIFIQDTLNYISLYEPEVTIVHSTIPPGTTRKLGITAIHSPIMGRHPTLAEHIRKFIKIVAGVNPYAVFEATDFLKKAGLQCFVFSSPEASELAKILETTYLGWNVLFMKEVAEICQKFNVPFHEVYTETNGIYNTGYAILQESRFMRPILYPMKGKIGGHCVVQNCNLLDTFLTRIIKSRNKDYEMISELSMAGIGNGKTEDNLSLLGGQKNEAKNRKRNKDLAY